MEDALKNLSPLERIQVQNAMNQIHADLEKVLPLQTRIGDIDVEAVRDYVLDSVQKMIPPTLTAIVTPSDEPNTLNVVFEGYVPHVLNIPSSNMYPLELKQNTIKEYFDNEIEYPNNIAENPLPLGTLYGYVSSASLNGFINYVNVVDAFVLHRYVEIDQDMTEHLEGRTYQEPAGSLNWTKYPTAITKKELIELVTQPKRLASFELNIFDDDIVLLAQAKADPTIFYFFWFDCDVSDCMIGRFQTEDSQATVVEKFRNFLNKLKFDRAEIPLHLFTGWMSF